MAFRTNQDEFLAAVRADLLDKFQSSADGLLLYVQANTPVDTGRLRSGWGIDYEPDGYTLYNPVPYASYVRDADYQQMLAGLEEWVVAEVEDAS